MAQTQTEYTHSNRNQFDNYINVALKALALKDYEKAKYFFKKAGKSTINRGNMPYAGMGIAICFICQGNAKAAKSELAKVGKEYGDLLGNLNFNVSGINKLAQEDLVKSFEDSVTTRSKLKSFENSYTTLIAATKEQSQPDVQREASSPILNDQKRLPVKKQFENSAILYTYRRVLDVISKTPEAELSSLKPWFDDACKAVASIEPKSNFDVILKGWFANKNKSQEKQFKYNQEKEKTFDESALGIKRLPLIPPQFRDVDKSIQHRPVVWRSRS